MNVRAKETREERKTKEDMVLTSIVRRRTKRRGKGEKKRLFIQYLLMTDGGEEKTRAGEGDNRTLEEI